MGGMGESWSCHGDAMLSWEGEVRRGRMRHNNSNSFLLSLTCRTPFLLVELSRRTSLLSFCSHNGRQEVGSGNSVGGRVAGGLPFAGAVGQVGAVGVGWLDAGTGDALRSLLRHVRPLPRQRLLPVRSVIIIIIII
jgi:hypothetical protein